MMIPGPRATTGRRAAALLEVVLSMAIFLAVAAIGLASVGQCVRAVGRLRLETRAVDLAVTVLSEVRMGVVEVADAGPEEMEPPMEAWTWEIRTLDVGPAPDLAPLRQVEVIVRHTQRGYAYRLVEWVPDPEAEELGEIALAPAPEGEQP